MLHPTSLPGPFGIGDLGAGAYRFVSFLQDSRQQIWQMLPLGPTGYGNSPYQTYSAFAGNPLLLSLEQLRTEGLLSADDLLQVPALPPQRVDYDAVHAVKDRYGIASLDLASGRFVLSEVQGEEALAGELERLRPAELLEAEDAALPAAVLELPGLRRQAPWHFELDSAMRALNGQFGTRSLAGFGAEELPVALAAAGCLLQYVKDTQRGNLPHIRALQQERRADSVILDAATRRNLELDTNLMGGQDNTLLSVIDATVTAMGSRLLRRWLHRPLTEIAALRARQDAVGALLADYRYEAVRAALKGVGDMERILTRVALRSARPRDLTRLATSLAALPTVRTALSHCDASLLRDLAATASEFPQQCALLDAALVDNPPMVRSATRSTSTAAAPSARPLGSKSSGHTAIRPR